MRLGTLRKQIYKITNLTMIIIVISHHGFAKEIFRKYIINISRLKLVYCFLLLLRSANWEFFPQVLQRHVNDVPQCDACMQDASNRTNRNSSLILIIWRFTVCSRKKNTHYMHMHHNHSKGLKISWQIYLELIQISCGYI